MAGRLPSEVKIHVEKARELAILAVDIYNKPATVFRSGGYIVLMCIAWTALFHAISFRQGVKPFHRDKVNPRRYQRIDGDYRAWELSDCIKHFFGTDNCPERDNLNFFVGLRNKIEHRSMPALDFRIFGQCQALLYNFEDLMFDRFGARYALNDCLCPALQFSRLRSAEYEAALAKLHAPLRKDVAKYIGDFNSSLSPDVRHDLRYSYKVFIVPKLVSNPGREDIAVEFVRFDPSKPEEMEKYAHVAALIKPMVTEGANVGRLRASDICAMIDPIVKQVVGPAASFHHSSHHPRACTYYGIRPVKGAADPKKTNTRYCHYDHAHSDYVYTRAWQEFLVKEMRKPGQYERMMRNDHS